MKDSPCRRAAGEATRARRVPSWLDIRQKSPSRFSTVFHIRILVHFVIRLSGHPLSFHREARVNSTVLRTIVGTSITGGECFCASFARYQRQHRMQERLKSELTINLLTYLLSPTLHSASFFSFFYLFKYLSIRQKSAEKVQRQKPLVQLTVLFCSRIVRLHLRSWETIEIFIISRRISKFISSLEWKIYEKSIIFSLLNLSR